MEGNLMERVQSVRRITNDPAYARLALRSDQENGASPDPSAPNQQDTQGNQSQVQENMTTRDPNSAETVRIVVEESYEADIDELQLDGDHNPVGPKSRKRHWKKLLQGWKRGIREEDYLVRPLPAGVDGSRRVRVMRITRVKKKPGMKRTWPWLRLWGKIKHRGGREEDV